MLKYSSDDWPGVQDCWQGVGMRVDGFLRTPIRGEHHALLRNLTVTETPPTGDPVVGDPYPQTLQLAFEADAPVQIAPLWEGSLQFVPDSVRHSPTVPAQVTPSRYASWPVTGDLLLRTAAGVLDAGFGRHLPGFTPLPAVVRYSKVVLTREFLFTTLAAAPKQPFTLGGVPVPASDPQHHQKLVIGILAGRVRFPVDLDSAQALPVIAPGGSLQLTIASTDAEMLYPSWFDNRPAYDDLSGESLVPPALRAYVDQLNNPAHPAHSVISGWALFQAAPDPAWAPDHPAASPLRTALTAALPDGRRYRRIELRRPPLPGPDPGASPRRPFPAYQLCWRPAAGGTTESLRLPLSGVAHVALADDTYRFWVIPRSLDPAAVLAGDQVRLSPPPMLPRLAGGPPQTALEVAIGAGPGAVIDAHLRAYDAAMAWAGYDAVAPLDRKKWQDQASLRWNVDAHLDWIVPPSPAHRPQSALYGLFRESAGRHGLSPEFLQVVFFGEGGGAHLAGSGAFNPNEVLDAYNFVGLDLIVYRTGRLPVGRPPVPPEVPAGAADERAEYAFNLVTAGYVDPAVAAAVTWDRTEVRVEATTRTLEVGTVRGWEAAIELVAAELHARLDEMVAYLAGKAPPIAVTDETTRRFLMYARFNAKPTTARGLADNLAGNLAPWTGPAPVGNLTARYNTLQRIAVAQWHDEAAAYREAAV